VRYPADLDFEYRCPTKVIVGKKAYKQVRSEVSNLGCKRAVLVTDRPLAENTDVVEMVKKVLAKYLAGVFLDVEPDSSFQIVDKAADYARSIDADCVVSVGGGSAMDTAKGLALLLKTGGTLADNLGINLQTEPVTPHVAIPTTAGTGSEVTHVAVIKDVERHQKALLLDGFLFPNTAILDPLMTVSLPPHLTAGTGMDALTHAVEAVHSIYRNPLSDANALQAIRIIRDNLVTAVEQPKDLGARTSMLAAANLAGEAFANAMVGVVHAIAHSIGALCGVHHGLANSLMLPEGIRFNAEEQPELYVPVAEALGVTEPGMSAKEAADRAAQACYDLAARSGMPTRLSEAGVEEAHLERIAEMAMSDGTILNNPRIVLEASEVMGMLKRAF
jgi:alcohol dehydrogenase